MTEREKKELYDMFGAEIMDFAFENGFEAFSDEMDRSGDVEKAYKKSQHKSQDKELDELEAMLNELFGDEDDFQSPEEEIAQMAHEIFEEDGTLPDACWDTMAGAVTGEPCADGVYLMSVACVGRDVYVIDRDGNKQYKIRRGEDPVVQLAASIYKFLSDRARND